MRARRPMAGRRSDAPEMMVRFHPRVRGRRLKERFLVSHVRDAGSTPADSTAPSWPIGKGTRMVGGDEQVRFLSAALVLASLRSAFVPVVKRIDHTGLRNQRCRFESCRGYQMFAPVAQRTAPTSPKRVMQVRILPGALRSRSST